MTMLTMENQKPAQPPAAAMPTGSDNSMKPRTTPNTRIKARTQGRGSKSRFWAVIGVGGLVVQFILAALPLEAADAGTNQLLPAIPEGYHLQEYDDCGMEGRQPHVLMKDCYLWTFNTSDTDAGLKERSAVFSYKGIQAVYDRLDPDASYVLALTYSSDHVYNRVQSLEANGVVLHGPYASAESQGHARHCAGAAGGHARRQDDAVLEDPRRGQCHGVDH